MGWLRSTSSPHIAASTTTTPLPPPVPTPISVGSDRQPGAMTPSIDNKTLQPPMGLAQGIARKDVSAQSDKELMFMAGERIVLLERLGNGQCLGYCEGIIGQFQEADVDFSSSSASSTSLALNSSTSSYSSSSYSTASSASTSSTSFSSQPSSLDPTSSCLPSRSTVKPEVLAVDRQKQPHPPVQSPQQQPPPPPALLLQQHQHQQPETLAVPTAGFFGGDSIDGGSNNSNRSSITSTSTSVCSINSYQPVSTHTTSAVVAAAALRGHVSAENLRHVKIKGKSFVVATKTVPGGPGGPGGPGEAGEHQQTLQQPIIPTRSSSRHHSLLPPPSSGGSGSAKAGLKTQSMSSFDSTNITTAINSRLDNEHHQHQQQQPSRPPSSLSTSSLQSNTTTTTTTTDTTALSQPQHQQHQASQKPRYGFSSRPTSPSQRRGSAGSGSGGITTITPSLLLQPFSQQQQQQQPVQPQLGTPQRRAPRKPSNTSMASPSVTSNNSPRQSTEFYGPGGGVVMVDGSEKEGSIHSTTSGILHPPLPPPPPTSSGSTSSSFKERDLKRNPSQSHLSAALGDFRHRASQVLKTMTGFSIAPNAGLFSEQSAREVDLNVIQLPTTGQQPPPQPLHHPPPLFSPASRPTSPLSNVLSDSDLDSESELGESSTHGSSGGGSKSGGKHHGFSRLKPWAFSNSNNNNKSRQRANSGSILPAAKSLQFTISSGASGGGDVSLSPLSAAPILTTSTSSTGRLQSGKGNSSNNNNDQNLAAPVVSGRTRRKSEAGSVQSNVSTFLNSQQQQQQHPFSRPSRPTRISGSEIGPSGHVKPNNGNILGHSPNGKWFGITSGRRQSAPTEDTLRPHVLGNGIEGGIRRPIHNLLEQHFVDDSDFDGDEDDDEDDVDEELRSKTSSNQGGVGAGKGGADKEESTFKDGIDPSQMYVNDYGFIYNLADDQNMNQDLTGTGSVVSNSTVVTDSSNKAESDRKKALLQETKDYRANEARWLDAMAHQQPTSVRKSTKFKKLVREGIPGSVRGRVWQFLAKADSYRQPGLFRELLTRAPLPIHEVIERDIHRCYPDHVHFRTGGTGTGQADLHEVLTAYAHYKPRIGYCQGMGRLVGMMLMQMPVEDAFWLLVATIEEYMQDYYTPTLRQLRIDAEVFAQLLKAQDKVLADHLEMNDIMPLMYMTQWFLTLFTMSLPWASVLRVWDVFYFEGVKAFFRIGLAILQLCRDHLLNACPTSNELLPFILHIPMDLLGPKPLLKTAFRIKLRRSVIQKMIMSTSDVIDKPSISASSKNSTPQPSPQVSRKSQMSSPPTSSSTSKSGTSGLSSSLGSSKDEKPVKEKRSGGLRGRLLSFTSSNPPVIPVGLAPPPPVPLPPTPGAATTAAST